jgi:dynein heavy chain 2
LEQAKKAVGSIKSENLNEVRSLRMPPEPIHDVLSAVLMLMGINDTSWLRMKNFLGERGVKDRILAFDARRITPSIRKDVMKILKAKSSSFDHATIKRASVAAAPLAAWVKANIQYSAVLQKIQPLQSELDKATRSLDEMSAGLERNQKELSTIDDKVARLKKDFAERTSEAEKLRALLEVTERKVERATELLGKLSGEKDRWERTVGELRTTEATLPKQILLAAGFVTYLAQSTEDVRERMVTQWTQEVGLDKFGFSRLMSSESEMLVWKGEGLPLTRCRWRMQW